MKEKTLYGITNCHWPYHEIQKWSDIDCYAKYVLPINNENKCILLTSNEISKYFDIHADCSFARIQTDFLKFLNLFS